jgi:hypothetical protein
MIQRESSSLGFTTSFVTSSRTLHVMCHRLLVAVLDRCERITRDECAVDRRERLRSLLFWNSLELNGDEVNAQHASVVGMH